MYKKNYLITGIISLIPLAITYKIIETLFNLISGPGKKIINFIFPDQNMPFTVHITGFILTFLFIYVIGFIISNVLGTKVYGLFERILGKIPLVSYIYSTIKQITDTLTLSQKQTFKKVVYIEYPKSDIWTIALVTGESKDKTGTKYYHLFVPTTPNPTSGFMLYIKQENAIETKLTIDEGLKVVISGGMLGPEKNDLVQ